MQLHVGVMRSEARGSVHIRSSNPDVHPVIRVNYLSGGERSAAQGGRDRGGAHDLRPARFRCARRQRGAARAEDDDADAIVDWVSRAAQTGLHLACTARMGNGEDSVVDPTDKRVHGVTGDALADQRQHLRTDDGHRRAGRDLILGNTPLPAAELPAAHAQPVAVPGDA